MNFTRQVPNKVFNILLNVTNGLIIQSKFEYDLPAWTSSPNFSLSRMRVNVPKQKRDLKVVKI